MSLTAEERQMLSPDANPAVAMAMRIVVETARLMGARELVEITGAHVDSCVYFSDAGVYFAERLRDFGGKVAVPTSLNVGALDLVNPDLIRAGAEQKAMAKRLMDACLDMGCQPSWTCAPYQAGFRPKPGEQIAWAESNAIVFANSILGARTNRYGDYFDICAALTGRAPKSGLHLDESRVATLLIDVSHLPDPLLSEETFYPVLGTWLGRTVGSEIAAIEGIPEDVPEDWLKALAAASASSGAVGLFHVIGVTPEAKTRDQAFDDRPPRSTLAPSVAELAAVRDSMSTTTAREIDSVALGSPHFSLDECRKLARLCEGRTFSKPVYVCTRYGVFDELGKTGEREKMQQAGVTFVIGTCVVVTPILRQASGVLMTNSGKFAHYSPSTVNHEVVFGSLEECVASAEDGRVRRDGSLWN